ncbi:MAG: hypothetical protein SFX73_15835 [Kofleriaceae bacterium]|nr:hypothetical protein [Kofleriaceae bacterium]
MTEKQPSPVRFVTVATRFAPRLTTEHSRWFELEAGEQDVFTNKLENEPTLGLDERGLAHVGQFVSPRALLIGRMTPSQGQELTPAEQLVSLIFNAQFDRLDRSLRVPDHCFGTVTAAVLEGRKARVRVSWTRPLEIGDCIEIDGQRFVVSAIREQDDDVDGVSVRGGAHVTKVSCARDMIQARSTGSYDAFTMQPVEGREDNGGQRIAGELVQILGQHAPSFLWECFTVKADVPRWDKLLGSIRARADRSEHVQPDVITRLAKLFNAMGLALTLDAPATGVRTLTAAELRSMSSGLVTAGGLFSQRVFGPVKDNVCECGKYHDEGVVVCAQCGVEVAYASIRRERLGHLELRCQHPLLGHAMEVLPVLPAGLRPLASPLNAAYERVLDVPQHMAQQAVDALFAELVVAVEMTWAMSRSKAVDWSGFAALTIDPSLPAGTCRLPRTMQMELFEEFAVGRLRVTYSVDSPAARRLLADVTPIGLQALDSVSANYPLLLACGANVVVRAPLPWDECAVAVDEATARKLGGSEVQVHIPLTTQAALELERLADLPRAAVSGVSGWLSEAARGCLMPLALRAARTGERELVSDSVIACALGRHPHSLN